MSKVKIGVGVSGSGTNLQAIMNACDSGVIDAEVVVVFSDNPGAYGLIRAEKAEIPTFVVDYQQIFRQWKSDPWGVRARLPNDGPDNNQVIFMAGYGRDSGLLSDKSFDEAEAYVIKRKVAEAEILEKLKPFNVDLLVLAGFMRLFTPYFQIMFNKDGDRIMNIHPSLLPKYPGTDGYGDTFRSGDAEGGCTVFFVDFGEDTGPIIGQRKIPIYPGDTLEEVKQRGLQEEYILYPDCIQLFAEGRLRVVTGKDGKKEVEILPELPPAA